MRLQAFKRLAAFLSGLDKVVRIETGFLSSVRADLILADIPFLAGFVSESAGVPAIAIGNFTWDWIFRAVPGAAALVNTVREGYKFRCALRLPLSQPEELGD